MRTYNFIMLGYFIALIVAINWKGNDFLRLPFGPRVLIAGACFVPLVTWVVIGNLLR